jgi:hypothetical protein
VAELYRRHSRRFKTFRTRPPYKGNFNRLDVHMALTITLSLVAYVLRSRDRTPTQ